MSSFATAARVAPEPAFPPAVALARAAVAAPEGWVASLEGIVKRPTANPIAAVARGKTDLQRTDDDPDDVME
jgi:hypothetical protein